MDKQEINDSGSVTYGLPSAEYLKVKGIDAIMRVNDRELLNFIVNLVDRTCVIHQEHHDTFRNRTRLNAKMMELSDEEEVRACCEPFSELVKRNVMSFITLCPQDQLLDLALLSPCKNGTFLLDWDTNAIHVAVSIGEQSFSYSIIHRQSLAFETDECQMNDPKHIASFYDKLRKALC